MPGLRTFLMLLSALVWTLPSFAQQPIEQTFLSITQPTFDAIELSYDDGIPGPRRDDPGEDWIFYDDENPRTLSQTGNLWSRVIFTPNANFELWGVMVMPLNQRGNNSECQIKVYSEDQDNHDLDELLWEGTIEQLRRYNGNPDNDWHWIELDEDDRVEIEAGDDFSIIYGPAPGGDYQNAREGDGWWNVWDGATEVNRSYNVAGDEPPEAHNQWQRIDSGDLFIRANGEYTGGFIDLGVSGVFNAEEEADRRWLLLLGSEKTLFAEITNEGDDVEEFTVTFEVFNPDGDAIFEREIEVEDGLEAENTLLVECDEAWETPEDPEAIGNYAIWVTVSTEDDVNEDNNLLGLDQIVFDQEASRDQWLGFVDDLLETSTNWQEGNGWSVRFDHPGTEVPLWITALQAGISGVADLDCRLGIHLIDFSGDQPQIEAVWESTGRIQDDWVTIELEEDDYITIHDGEGLIVTYFYINGGTFRGDATPPIAGVAAGMPPAMMQTQNNGQSFDHAHSGDYAIRIKLSGPDHGGVLTGTVTDTEDDSPIDHAQVITSQDHRGWTDEEGHFIFPFGPSGDFSVTVSKDGYNTATVEDLHLENDEELDIEIGLLHPEFEASENGFIVELEPVLESTFEFDVANDGNGPLIYSIERRLVDEVGEPWEERLLQNIEEVVEDTYLNGVVFVEDYFYISGGTGGVNFSKIYVLDTEGELVRDFDQFHESRYGMRDLTWDGELIWGADERTLYGFNTAGELIETIEGEAGSYRALTWNPDRGVFLSSDIATNIFLTDREGNLVGTINRPDAVRTYGLAYWSDDPDGYNLYASSRGEDTDLMIAKINLEDSDFIIETEFDYNDCRPGGICMTNEFDVFNWAFVWIIQSPDNLSVWHIGARREWFQIDPEDGEIAAGEYQEFTLTINASGLPTDNIFEGELVFHHNAEGLEAVIPVTLEVVEGEVHTFRNLTMNVGWNMVSVNLQPDEEDIEVLLADLIDAGSLLMMKDGSGHFFHAATGFNNIPGWVVDEGYLIKMADEATVTLVGWSVLYNEPIELEEGWQIASYYPPSPVEATLALSGIEDHLIIAKDGRGNFYIPEWEFSNMGDMRKYQGYYLNVDANVNLVYVIEEQDDALGNLNRQTSVYSEPGLLPVHKPTGKNMSLLVLVGNSQGDRQSRSFGISYPEMVDIGVYSSNVLVGSGVMQDGICGIAVWGDDPLTDAIDGALQGQPLEIRFLENGILRTVNYTLLSGEPVYTTDALTVISVSEPVELPNEFGIISAYPNPFNSSMRISYGLPEAIDISLNLCDITGRRVAELTSGYEKAGVHTIMFDGSNLSSGVYIIRMDAAGLTSQWKAALIR
ncbi:MAG: carboxypeptidase regulatory-like domain-containing protein [Candidatus Hatepunaea meridiana]|nr:carboxypeptidase regulatory-like domain-containing protein [Candidatus Hatepunaea meridiana]